MVLLGHFPFGGRCKPWAVAKETKKKKKRLCQKEICAVMSFHNCLGITNYGLSLPLDLCQRTLASIMGVLGWGFFWSRVENNGFFVARTLHVKLLQPMSSSEKTM